MKNGGGHVFFTEVDFKTRMRRDDCIAEPCNMWGSWAPITQCDISCGGGMQSFRRECSCSGGNYEC